MFERVNEMEWAEAEAAAADPYRTPWDEHPVVINADDPTQQRQMSFRRQFLALDQPTQNIEAMRSMGALLVDDTKPMIVE